jgi:hypothetical protein
VSIVAPIETSTTTGTGTGTGTTSTMAFSYEVPIDPMDELHCESCQ